MTLPRVLLPLLIAVLAHPAAAVTVRQRVLATAVNESSCAAPRPVASVAASQRQVFLWFVAERVRRGDHLQVDWLDPQGAIVLSAPYPQLPAEPSLCLITALPIAGQLAGGRPGTWSVRVRANNATLFALPFTVLPEAVEPGTGRGGLAVTRAAASRTASDQHTLTLTGAGFAPDATVHVAQYTPDAGWRYVANMRARTATAERMEVSVPGLTPAEYKVVVRNPGGALSAPVALVLSSGGYRLPTPAGEAWELTQGNNGAFSHYNRAMYAYDIAPRGGGCIVAMRAGIARTHDRGMGQTPRLRSFGNYITIDHGDGEWSHYGHLARGTFVVRDGQWVEQGQALAQVGNSGYTLGAGGGYHVHAHVTRSPSVSAQSVPFVFEDAPGPLRRGRLVSANASPLADCSRRVPAMMAAGRLETPAARPVAAASSAKLGHLSEWRADVHATGWWHQGLAIGKGTRVIDVELLWQGGANLDLHLVSPSGRHYGWYGQQAGYSGRDQNPERFRLPQPEPGLWRISVNAQAAVGGAVPFQVSASMP